MRLIVFIFTFLLMACSSAPKDVLPAMKLRAEAAHRQALSATQLLRWHDAELAWQDALITYQAIDDWSGQGMARLGLAQTYERLAKPEQAETLLEKMPAQKFFPLALRIQANYQLALLKMNQEPEKARAYLDAAHTLCQSTCLLQGHLANAYARWAMQKNDWVAVEKYALQAQNDVKNFPGELAHAQRMLAQVALQNKKPSQALVLINAALQENKKLADTEAILADYKVLRLVAQQLADAQLLSEVQTRITSLCSVYVSTQCPSTPIP